MKYVFGLLFWLATVGVSLASDGGGLNEVVQVRVWSVHATKDGAVVDDALKRVAKHLQRLDYGSFKLLRKDGAGIPPRGSKKIEIAGGKTVRVTVLERNKERARVRVQIADAEGIVLDTTVAIRRNGFFIVAGPRHRGGILVLPIFARY